MTDSTDSVPEDERLVRGLGVRREVLGEAHVERTLAAATDFDRDFQEYLTRAAWGDIWTRPGLERPIRHLLTIALLAALDKREELELHLGATRNTGVTPEQVREALMHVGVYAGIPAANAAMRTAKRVLFVEAAAQAPPPESPADLGAEAVPKRDVGPR